MNLYFKNHSNDLQNQMYVNVHLNLWNVHQ